MNIHHFIIILKDANAFDNNLDDRLFIAGCDDALVCRLGNLVYLEFDKEAVDAKTAIADAFNNLNQAGFVDLVLQKTK